MQKLEKAYDDFFNGQCLKAYYGNERARVNERFSLSVSRNLSLNTEFSNRPSKIETKRLHLHYAIAVVSLVERIHTKVTIFEI